MGRRAARLGVVDDELLPRSVADVLLRLLDAAEGKTRVMSRSKRPILQLKESPSPRAEVRKVAGRHPRERGIRAQLGDRVLTATSVKDLYAQTLRILVDTVPSDQLSALAPFATSKDRYLLAKKPVHPNGRQFFHPVDHRGFFMEAHKDYRNAVSHLGKLTAKVGLPLRYLGS